jgi:hypothetical protein
VSCKQSLKKFGDPRLRDLEEEKKEENWNNPARKRGFYRLHFCVSHRESDSYSKYTSDTKG